MARDTSARRREAAELRLPTARLTLIRIWSVVGAIVIAATVLNVLGVLSPVIEFWPSARLSLLSSRLSSTAWNIAAFHAAWVLLSA